MLESCNRVPPAQQVDLEKLFARRPRRGRGPSLGAACLRHFPIGHSAVTLSAMTRTPRARLGRPPHTDDPPHLFSTTIPESVYGMLCALSDGLHQTKSVGESAQHTVDTLW